jgi:phage tail sheath protein FI
LGISELGYSSLTAAQVSVRNAAANVEYDLFQYQGATTSGTTQLLGFHMENTANALEFISGNKNSMTGYTNSAGSLDRGKLKFTVVPAGGFDGWDKYKQYDNYYEKFAEGMVDNIQCFKDGIETFASAEAVDINVLAVPGVDYKNNEELVKYALNVTETRADLFYIMDSPRLTVGTVKGTPEEAVEHLELTGIDTSYAATYWPWIQVQDVNTQRLTYIPPTAEAVRAFAYTDNRYQAWFAPAGALRATLGPNVKRTDVKLSRAQMDTLYAGRINPIATSTQNGMSIWGQKTLQVAQNALDRINVRRLLLRIERLVASASYNLIFDQNDQATRDQFLSRVEPVLLQIQNQRGISGFRVVMDDSNNTTDDLDSNTLNGKIQIKPVGALEFLNLTFQLLPTGANFEEF